MVAAQEDVFEAVAAVVKLILLEYKPAKLTNSELSSVPSFA